MRRSSRPARAHVYSNTCTCTSSRTAVLQVQVYLLSTSLCLLAFNTSRRLIVLQYCSDVEFDFMKSIDCPVQSMIKPKLARTQPHYYVQWTSAVGCTKSLEHALQGGCAGGSCWQHGSRAKCRSQSRSRSHRWRRQLSPRRNRPRRNAQRSRSRRARGSRSRSTLGCTSQTGLVGARRFT